jgi:hypothetical protein
MIYRPIIKVKDNFCETNRGDTESLNIPGLDISAITSYYYLSVFPWFWFPA